MEAKTDENTKKSSQFVCFRKEIARGIWRVWERCEHFLYSFFIFASIDRITQDIEVKIMPQSCQFI